MRVRIFRRSVSELASPARVPMPLPVRRWPARRPIRQGRGSRYQLRQFHRSLSLARAGAFHKMSRRAASDRRLEAGAVSAAHGAGQAPARCRRSSNVDIGFGGGLGEHVHLAATEECRRIGVDAPAGRARHARRAASARPASPPWNARRRPAGHARYDRLSAACSTSSRSTSRKAPLGLRLPRGHRAC